MRLSPGGLSWPCSGRGITNDRLAASLCRQSLQQPQLRRGARERCARWAALFAAPSRRQCRDQGRKPWRERPQCAHCQWPCACPEGSLTPWLSVSVSVLMIASPPSTKAVTCAADVVLNRGNFVRTIWSRSCGKSWLRNLHAFSGRRRGHGVRGVHDRCTPWSAHRSDDLDHVGCADHHMLDAGSVLGTVQGSSLRSARAARGLRALTVPARRSRLGHYVMAGGVMTLSWTDLDR